jgi:hypothetical protein
MLKKGSGEVKKSRTRVGLQGSILKAEQKRKNEAKTK